jgi:hypothetical protein
MGGPVGLPSTAANLAATGMARTATSAAAAGAAISSMGKNLAVFGAIIAAITAPLIWLTTETKDHVLERPDVHGNKHRVQFTVTRVVVMQ